MLIQFSIGIIDVSIEWFIISFGSHVRTDFIPIQQVVTLYRAMHTTYPLRSFIWLGRVSEYVIEADGRLCIQLNRFHTI